MKMHSLIAEDKNLTSKTKSFALHYVLVHELHYKLDIIINEPV